ncbi:MAG: hypothetical protein Q7R95_07345 [bacterium]|nr:hypothetical protein [bacterium]
MKRYILIDNDGDIVSDKLRNGKSGLIFHGNFKDAYLDAKSIASRRTKNEKIYIFQEFGIVEGKE